MYARGRIRTPEPLREWTLNPSPLARLGNPRTISKLEHNGGCATVAQLVMPTNDIGIPVKETFVEVKYGISELVD